MKNVVKTLILKCKYVTYFAGDVEQPCLQTKDGENRSTSLCTFCWSAVKKDVS